jgi:AcrR family transcriptional regulator
MRMPATRAARRPGVTPAKDITTTRRLGHPRMRLALSHRNRIVNNSFIVHFSAGTPPVMSQHRAHAPTSDTCTVILDAAQSRLLEFGYHKTTMAEIASDCGMSAANLYRYFANKEEIAAECATRCMNERLERLRPIVEDSSTSADDKLLAYALMLIDDSHALAGPDSKIGELVATITQQRPGLVHEKLAIHHRFLAAILEQGRATGEFDYDDAETTARDIHTVLTLFDVPLFVGLHERAEFERRAHGVVRIVLDGLRPRPRRRR